MQQATIVHLLNLFKIHLIHVLIVKAAVRNFWCSSS